MTQSAVITRTELGLGDLSITSSTLQLDVEGVTGAGLTWRRRTVSSPYIDGTFEVSATRDAGQLSLKGYVLGTSSAGLRAATIELTNAISASTFDLLLTVDSFVYRFVCYRADYAVGLSSGDLRALVVPVTITAPYAPGFGIV